MPESRVSFVMSDCVITVSANLMQTFMGERGWGALTEHHGLVMVRDAIDFGYTCKFPSVQAALQHAASETRSVPLLIASRIRLPAYSFRGVGAEPLAAAVVPVAAGWACSP